MCRFRRAGTCASQCSFLLDLQLRSKKIAVRSEFVVGFHPKETTISGPIYIWILATNESRVYIYIMIRCMM